MVIRSLLILCGVALAQNDCNAILKGGIFNTWSQTQKLGTKLNEKDYFCSSEFESSVKSGSQKIDGNIIIDGAPLKFDSEIRNSSSWQKRQQICSDKRRDLSTDEATSVLSRIASEDIIKAWSECNKNSFGGNLPIRLSKNVNSSDPDNITYKLEYTQIGNLAIPTVLGVSLTNFNLIQGSFSGKVEPSIPQTVILKRNNRLEGSLITVRTTLGDLTDNIKPNLNGSRAGFYVVVTPKINCKMTQEGSASHNFKAPGACHNKNDACSWENRDLKCKEPNCELKNCRVDCPDKGGACRFFNNDIPFIEGKNTCVARGTHRSVETTVNLVAEKWIQTCDTTIEESRFDNLAWGSTFVVSQPNNQSVAVKVSLNTNTFVFIASEITNHPLVQFENKISVGSDVYYTYRLIPPSQ